FLWNEIVVRNDVGSSFRQFGRPRKCLVSYPGYFGDLRIVTGILSHRRNWIRRATLEGPTSRKSQAIQLPQFEQTHQSFSQHAQTSPLAPYPFRIFSITISENQDSAFVFKLQLPGTG